MMWDTLVVAIISLIAIGILVYAIYKKRNKPSFANKTLDDFMNNDPVFNQSLSPDQINALYRLVTTQVFN